MNLELPVGMALASREKKCPESESECPKDNQG